MAQVIETILLDDNPKGLRLIEVKNWSGRAFVVPRSKLKEFRKRTDAEQPGIYFLFGSSEQPRVYIGQSENVLDRISSHNANRKEDEWDTAFFFVGTLDSTFIKYLESITIELAKKSDRYKIFNSASPKENKLSEAQKIIATEYLEKIKTITSLFGYPIFDGLAVQNKDLKIYYFYSWKGKDPIDARGSLLDSEEFVIYKGSMARIYETPNFRIHSPGIRERLLRDGTLVKKDDRLYEFTQDYIFTSTSAAADTVMGRSMNGWTAWIDEQGKTLDENVRK